MWKHFAAILSLYTVMLYATPILAQDTSTQKFPAKWSLQDCLDYAIKNNITINILLQDQLSGKQDLLLAKAGSQPNLNGSVYENLNYQKGINSSGGYYGRKIVDNGGLSLNSSILLYQGGYIRNNIREKQLYLQSAGLNILQEENDITLNVTQAFLNILLAKENIVYLEDLLITSLAQRKQAQQKYDAGTIALKDLAELQSQTANDKYSLVSAQSTHRQNIISLKQLLQLPSAVAFEVQEPDTLMAIAIVPELTEVQQQALLIRPEVKISGLTLQIARVDLQLARFGYFPTLTGSGTISASHSGGDPIYLQQQDNTFYQQIGLTLSIPIFNKRVTRTNVEKAKIAIVRAQLNLNNTKNNLSLTIEQAYINVTNARSQYDAAVEQLNFAKESYRIASEQLKVGAANTVDFLQQKNLYVQAFGLYTKAKYNAALTIRIYDFYRGVPIKL